MRRILLTGPTGFIGAHAVRPLLDRGFEVHALSRRRANGDLDGVVWHTLDLLDPDATARVVTNVGASHLLHFAWYAEHGKFWEAAENLDWVAASSRLLRCFHESGGSRVVVAGTCAEYDWSGECCDERTPLRPGTLYGASKDAFRRVCEAYAGSVGMNAAWGRVFFTYGPGEHRTRVVASVARALVAGEPVACSSGTQIRDFLYVEDLADAFAALTDSDVEGALDIGSGEPIALRELLGRLEQLAGRSDLVRLGEATGRDEPLRIVADTRRLRDELGWMPSHSLDQGLATTLSWWRTQT